MKILQYRGLSKSEIPGLAKLVAYLKVGDCKSADIKKIRPGLYRARLDRKNRLLLSLANWGAEKCWFLLEYIPNHDYASSRFLRGSKVDESRLETIEQVETEECEELEYLNSNSDQLAVFDKFISYNDSQEEICRAVPPILIAGTAGSGKTLLALEKMKGVAGNILYVSLSPQLVRRSRDLYNTTVDRPAGQTASFLSFVKFLEGFGRPPGRWATFEDFLLWLTQQPGLSAQRDSYMLYEEFMGVIGGALPPQGPPRPLTRSEYSALGLRQALFPPRERATVYDFFAAYAKHLEQRGLCSLGLTAGHYHRRIKPTYDFLVIDEAQDLTPAQQYLLLRSLKAAGQFVVCGDSNQVVHPNFFSWSAFKSLLHHRREFVAHSKAVCLCQLDSNFRNPAKVADAANQVLRLKRARFGSLDRESNTLLAPMKQYRGEVSLLAGNPEMIAELNERAARSTDCSVIVLRERDKAAAARAFDTPLIFSVREAKGLEYPNIILYNLVDSAAKEFSEIARGLDRQKMSSDFVYARARNKSDKSFHRYKFYVNALYVGMTRTLRSLYLVERDPSHILLQLLELSSVEGGELSLEAHASTAEDWRKEARKLEEHGRSQQAEAILQRFHQPKIKSASWQPLTAERIAETVNSRLNPVTNRLEVDSRERQALYRFALLHRHFRLLRQLAPAKRQLHIARDTENLDFDLGLGMYASENPAKVMQRVKQYGVNYRDPNNFTPLMHAARVGNASLTAELRQQGADLEAVNSIGLNALQIAIAEWLYRPQEAKKAKDSWAELYLLLSPPELLLMIEGRLVKIEPRRPEFLLFHLSLSLFYANLSAWHQASLFSPRSLAFWTHIIPAAVWPPKWGRREAIGKMLQRCELSREGGGLPLFLRPRRGNYLPNSALLLKSGDGRDQSWRPLSERLLPGVASAIVDDSLVPLTGPGQRSAKVKQKVKPESEDDLRWSDFRIERIYDFWLGPAREAAARPQELGAP